MHTVVAEMTREQLLEEREYVLQRLENLKAGRSSEGTVNEMHLRLERIKRLLDPEQVELS